MYIGEGGYPMYIGNIGAYEARTWRHTWAKRVHNGYSGAPVVHECYECSTVLASGEISS